MPSGLFPEWASRGTFGRTLSIDQGSGSDASTQPSQIHRLRGRDRRHSRDRRRRRAENADKLKIGFVGVTSGPAAAWGTSNVRSMQTLAAWLNEKGGVKIGDKTYDIEIVTFDDQKDPKRAIAGMEKMAQEGIHYVVGPNVDDGAAAVRPVAEAKGIIYFPYAFPKALYTKPASNAVLGMVANYQSGPAIYKYLKENKGVKTIAFVAANESDPLSQRDGGVAAAKALGLEVVAETDTYQNDTTRLHAGADADRQAQARPAGALRRRAGQRAAADPRRARARLRGPDLHRDRAGRQGAGGGRGRARQRLHLGRRRLDAGDRARTTMEEFVDRYTKMFGEYNDESNTKVYALAIHPRHAEGEPGGDRRRRGVQEDHRHLLGARTPT